MDILISSTDLDNKEINFLREILKVINNNKNKNYESFSKNFSNIDENTIKNIMEKLYNIIKKYNFDGILQVLENNFLIPEISIPDISVDYEELPPPPPPRISNLHSHGGRNNTTKSKSTKKTLGGSATISSDISLQQFLLFISHILFFYGLISLIYSDFVHFIRKEKIINTNKPDDIYSRSIIVNDSEHRRDKEYKNIPNNIFQKKIPYYVPYNFEFKNSQDILEYLKNLIKNSYDNEVEKEKRLMEDIEYYNNKMEETLLDKKKKLERLY